MKYILMDVEGTTTSISFVHDVLFPYSSERLENYINTHFDSLPVQEILVETFNTAVDEEKLILNHAGLINKLLSWIKTDRKHPALKRLQGLIWNEGYHSGKIKGHIYPDVPVALEAWNKVGLTLGVYSSGSVSAQKDLFTYSELGNLQHFFSHNFDTAVGVKREVESYKKISTELKLDPSEILFLSDITEELDAAKLAGFQTVQLARLGAVLKSSHKQIKSFAELESPPKI